MPDPLPATQITPSASYVDIPVPKSAQVNYELPLTWVKYLCAGGAANGLLFASAVGGQAGYRYLDGNSVYINVRYKG